MQASFPFHCYSVSLTLGSWNILWNIPWNILWNFLKLTQLTLELTLIRCVDSMLQPLAAASASVAPWYEKRHSTYLKQIKVYQSDIKWSISISTFNCANSLKFVRLRKVSSKQVCTRSIAREGSNLAMTRWYLVIPCDTVGTWCLSGAFRMPFCLSISALHMAWT